MLQIKTKGLKNGDYEIDETENTEKLEDLLPEFFGDIKLTGILTKSDRRLTFNGKAECDAKMFCDISGEEYIERIVADINVIFIINNELYFAQRESGQFDIDMDTEIALHEDDFFYDLTQIVRDELSLALPMKRVSPEYRGKDFAECFPQYSAKKEVDDRWEKLKDIKFH